MAAPYETPDEIYPITILMDEFKSEDTQLLLNAIHRLSTITLALGPERAREDLLHFPQDTLDDEDEVLSPLTEEMGKNLEQYIGGPEHGHLLLPLLENLASTKETLTMDKISRAPGIGMPCYHCGKIAVGYGANVSSTMQRTNLTSRLLEVRDSHGVYVHS